MRPSGPWHGELPALALRAVNMRWSDFQGSLDFLEENNQDDLCYYMFSLASKVVCGYPGNLTVGDIILIL